MRSNLTIALLLTFTAAATTQEREKAEATWTEGKMTIEYGAPTWRDAFTERMASQAIWRLGQNDPTRVNMTCALMTGTGAIPAGDYGMALKKNGDGKWDLVVYKGGGFFNEKMQHWIIEVSGAKASDASAEKLILELSDNKQLAVRFGPHASNFSFKPIKMLAPITAEFARMPATVEVMALPVGDKVSKLHVGSSTIEARGVKIAWNMLLTIDGDKASLVFENTRAKAIAGEKKEIESTVERVKGRLEGADEEETKRIEDFLGRQQEAMEKLEEEAAVLEAFKPQRSVTGTVSNRSESTSTLTLESERIEGGLVLIFGAGNNTASFTVTPRDFRVQQRRRR